MRRIESMLPALLLLVLAAQGCALFGPIAPGSDPVLVNAERSFQAAFETVDTLLRLEKANQPFVAEHLPSVHDLCQSIRKDAQSEGGGAFGRAETAIEQYRSFKRPEDQPDLKSKLAVVADLAARAKAALEQLHQKGVR